MKPIIHMSTVSVVKGDTQAKLVHIHIAHTVRANIILLFSIYAMAIRRAEWYYPAKRIFQKIPIIY